MAEIGNRSTILGVLLLLALSALVAILAIGRTANTPLQSMLSDESCTKACWHGIETGVTDRETVTDMLNDANIDVHVIPGVGDEGYAVYEWVPPGDWTVVEGDNNAAFAVIVFRGGVVSHVDIPADICVSSVIDEYGAPTKVNAETEDTYLLYPQQGVAFMVSASSGNRVSAILLPADEWFTDWLDDPSLQDWSEIADEFSGECEDSLTR